MAADGTMMNPVPNSTSQIEPKVKWMAIVTYLASLLLVGLGEILQDGTFLQILPPSLAWLGILVAPFVPTLVALIAGFAARHQWRSNEVTAPGVPGSGGNPAERP